MILLPNRKYSQGFLDELNLICHGFLDPAIDYLSDVVDDTSLAEDLEPYFPSYLLYEDAEHCYSIIKELYEWLEDDFYHPVTRLHEYMLMRVIRDQWAFLMICPKRNQRIFEARFTPFRGRIFLLRKRLKNIVAMKDDELITLRAIVPTTPARMSSSETRGMSSIASGNGAAAPSRGSRSESTPTLNGTGKDGWRFSARMAG